jgi:hypothetical protein
MKNRGWGPWRGVVVVNGKVVGQDSAPSKMGNIITTVEGIRFQSKAEGKYATNLNNMVKAGEVKFYLRQVGFDIPGKARHFVDFLVFFPDGTWKFVEAKGRDLPLGKLKRKQVEEIYGIKIELTK